MSTKKMVLVVLSVAGVLLTAVLMFWLFRVEPYQRQARILKHLENANLLGHAEFSDIDHSPFPGWIHRFLPESWTASFHRLERLALHEKEKGLPVETASLRRLARLPFSPQLDFWSLEASDSLVDGILGCKGLTHLRFLGGSLDDEQLRRILDRHELRHLTLHSCPNITPQGLVDVLSRETDLEYLNIANMYELGPEAAGVCEILADFPHLQELDLLSSRINDEDVKILSRSKSLQILNLNGNPAISDESLKSIATMPSLNQVHLVHTDVSGYGIQEFRAAKPGCMVLQ